MLVQARLWVHDGQQLVLQDVEFVPGVHLWQPCMLYASGCCEACCSAAAPSCLPPGLYKIFDEILVNAADNKVRDPKMDTLKVDIDAVSLLPPAPIHTVSPSHTLQCCSQKLEHLHEHQVHPAA